MYYSAYYTTEPDGLQERNKGDKRKMKIRRAKEKDVAQIMNLIRQAQEYMRSQRIDQWQDGYPSEEVIKRDILDGISYVAEEGEKVVGTFAFTIAEEPTYHKIYEGTWRCEGDYGVIHRVAVDNESKGKGIGGRIVEYAAWECKKHKATAVRIDTHRDNQSMQRMLLKNGFEKRGIIYLEDGAERIAFEKVLK